jgi:hypothetical protein
MNQMWAQLKQLCIQSDQLNRELGRPRVTLTFKEVDYSHAPDEPGVPYDAHTEFLASCSGGDVFDVFIQRVQIGKMFIQSRIQTEKLAAGEPKKLEYVVLYHDDRLHCECVNLSFRGHLRNLLDEVVKETGQDSLYIPISVSYSDIYGRSQPRHH